MVQFYSLCIDRTFGRNHNLTLSRRRLWLWCLTPLSTLFQLYRSGQFYWWMKTEYPEKITDPPQVTETLSHNVVPSTHRLSGVRTYNGL